MKRDQVTVDQLIVQYDDIIITALLIDDIKIDYSTKLCGYVDAIIASSSFTMLCV